MDQQTMEKEILQYFETHATKPLSVNELEEALEMEDAEDFPLLMKSLNALEESGQLIRTRKNRYGLPEKMNLVRGRIQMHQKGFAFLIPDEEGMDDVYINQADLASAMNGDIVFVRVDNRDENGKRAEQDKHIRRLELYPDSGKLIMVLILRIFLVEIDHHIPSPYHM